MLYKIFLYGCFGLIYCTLIPSFSQAEKITKDTQSSYFKSPIGSAVSPYVCASSSGALYYLKGKQPVKKIKPGAKITPVSYSGALAKLTKTKKNLQSKKKKTGLSKSQKSKLKTVSNQLAYLPAAYQTCSNWKPAPTQPVPPELSTSCADLVGADTAKQLAILSTSGLDCSTDFVDLLLEDPSSFQSTLATGAASSDLSEKLFFAVYSKITAKEFLFSASAVPGLIASLQASLAKCTLSRCQDWDSYVLQPLIAGTFTKNSADETPGDGSGPQPTPSPTTTPTPSPTPAPNCAELETESSTQQFETLQKWPAACAPAFVEYLIADPWKYLETFYKAIATVDPSFYASVSDQLYNAVSSSLSSDNFKFPSDVLYDMYLNLPAAVAKASGGYYTSYWTSSILNYNFYTGDFYQCPKLDGLTLDQLVEISHHGNYGCIEALSALLVPLADTDLVDTMLTQASTAIFPWARRNAIRVLNNLGLTSATSTLIQSTKKLDIQLAMHERLKVDTFEDVLDDAIYIIVNVVGPYLPAQPELEEISANLQYQSSLRWRAISGVGSLVSYKTYALNQVLNNHDRDFLIGSLSSDDEYVRSEAAWTLGFRLNKINISAADKVVIKAALNEVYNSDPELIAQYYAALALDSFDGTHLVDALKASWQANHLPTTVNNNDGSITIVSGLPIAETQNYALTLDSTRAAYTSFLGSWTAPVQPFDSHVTLYLFASPDDYYDYMVTFGPCCADSGGVYIQQTSTFYTYDRTPAQSIYSTEELVKHEFTHYLSDIHIYPGVFGIGDYFSYSPIWSNEGMSEVFAGIELGAGGGYSFPPREVHLKKICNETLPPIDDVLGVVSDYGSFKYRYGWALTYFMLMNHYNEGVGVYQKCKDKTYLNDLVPSYLGLGSKDSLNTAWHDAIDSWCISGGFSGPQGPSDSDNSSSADSGAAGPDGAQNETSVPDDFEHFERPVSGQLRSLLHPPRSNELQGPARRVERQKMQILN